MRGALSRFEAKYNRGSSAYNVRGGFLTVVDIVAIFGALILAILISAGVVSFITGDPIEDILSSEDINPKFEFASLFLTTLPPTFLLLKAAGELFSYGELDVNRTVGVPWWITGLVGGLVLIFATQITSLFSETLISVVSNPKYSGLFNDGASLDELTGDVGQWASYLYYYLLSLVAFSISLYMYGSTAKNPWPSYCFSIFLFSLAAIFLGRLRLLTGSSDFDEELIRFLANLMYVALAVLIAHVVGSAVVRAILSAQPVQVRRN